MPSHKEIIESRIADIGVADEAGDYDAKVATTIAALSAIGEVYRGMRPEPGVPSVFDEQERTTTTVPEVPTTLPLRTTSL